MEKSKVYFIKDITPENIIKAYEAVGKKLEGNQYTYGNLYRDV